MNRNGNKAESVEGNFVASDDWQLFSEVACSLYAEPSPGMPVGCSKGGTGTKLRIFIALGIMAAVADRSSASRLAHLKPINVFWRVGGECWRFLYVCGALTVGAVETFTKNPVKRTYGLFR